MANPVERWLETFMCKQYADTFEAYGYKTLQSVGSLGYQSTSIITQIITTLQQHAASYLSLVPSHAQ